MKKLFILTLLLFAVHASYAQRYRDFGTNEYPKFRIGLQGGWSYMIAKISDQVPDEFRPHLERLKSGYHYGADGSFFFNRSIGLGIRYSGFRTKDEMPGLYGMDTSTGQSVQGSLSEDISINYVGPVFNMRYISESQVFHLVSTMSIGYLSYNNKVGEFTSNYALKSATLGTVLGVGVDFAVHRNILLGMEISGTFGTLSYYDMETNAMSQHVELPEDQQEGVSRVDVSAGIRFNF